MKKSEPEIRTIFVENSDGSLIERATKEAFLRKVVVKDKDGKEFLTTEGELLVAKALQSMQEKPSINDVLTLKKVLGEDKQVSQVEVVGSDFFLGLGKPEEYDRGGKDIK